MNAPAQTALSPAPFDRKEAERFLMDALGRALEQRPVAVVRFPAPRAPADAMLRALLYEAANSLLTVVRKPHPLKDWARRAGTSAASEIIASPSCSPPASSTMSG